MKLSEMKHLLAAGRIQLTKSLGQNFLHDTNQLRRIVAAAELTKSDQVLEVGPGLGPLTEMLLEQAGEVLAIEKDARLVQLLRERFKVSAAPQADAAPGLRLLHDDALAFLRREPRDWSDWKVVSNLPYSVASRILVELAQARGCPQRMVATLQIEVAKRLMAHSGEKDYGVLTLLTQLQYEPRDWFKVPAGCFFPEPDVDSGCVTLVRRPQPLLTPEQSRTFSRVVKRAFSQRRKMMIKLLKAEWDPDDVERAFEGLRLPASIRAESVSLEQFVSLARLMHTQDGAPMVKEEIFDVVNARDEVIDHKPRSEVHRLGLMHRAVHVLVFNSRGQVFLQKRSMKKDRQPGVWDSSSSGHLERGEDYDACAMREVREELGLMLPTPPQRLFKLAASSETDQEHVWVYRCQAEGPFALAPEEIEQGGWFAPDEISRWMTERPQDFATALLAFWGRLARQTE